MKQVSVWERKNRTEKIHLRIFLALSLSIPLKSHYSVCRDSWDPGTGSSHPAMPSVLHYMLKDVGEKKHVFMLENHVKYFVQASDIGGTFIPADVARREDHGLTLFTVHIV